MPVSFHEQTKVTLRERNKLKAFIREIFRLEGQQIAMLDIIFCTDDYLKSINIQFLQHNYFTDIITFNLTTPPSKKIIAEIYISVERVRENAYTHATSFKNELHRIIFHGALHLCGYKDKRNSNKVLMTEKENTYLDMYF